MGDASAVTSLELPEDANDPEPRKVGCLGILALCSSAPVVILAIGALTGLGLERHLAGFPAVAGATALVVLPILGLASLITERGHAAGSRAAVLGGGAWFWALAILLAMPFYFPNERARAVGIGLEFLSASAADETRERVVEVGDQLVTLLGAEPEHLPKATSLPQEEDRSLGARPAGASPRVEPGGRVVIPYDGDDRMMRVATFFDGPRFGEEFPMVFDTGATYTTLDRPALALLELDRSESPPIVTLRTANGEVEAPLVLVDAVWIGDAVLEWVTVAVCDSCAGEEVSGLLGLNVTGQFQVTIDHADREIGLELRESDAGRRLDVMQWLRLSSRLRHWRDGRSEVEVRGRNLARIGIREASVHIVCPRDRFEVLVGPIQAGSAASARMSLPFDTDCSEYTVELASAQWASERF
jgi:hypothetical protein